MSDTSSDDESVEISPPWGALAIEKYLLQKWDDHSSDNPDEQRRRLVREYVREGKRWDPTQPPLPAPTSTQISQILQPFRTLSQRYIAANPGPVSTVWLRTCYNPGTDEIHDDLIASVEIDNAIDGPEYVLSDPALYNFELTDANNNENWSLILDILPELVGLPNLDEQHAHDASIQSAIIKFHAADAALAADTNANTDPSTPIPNNPTIDFIKRTREYYPADQVRAQVLKAMQSSIHKACVVNYLVVEDKRAFVISAGATAEDMRLRLLFLDARGRIVRETRIDGPTAENLGGSWMQSSWDDDDEWIEAEWGEDYCEGGREGGLALFREGST